MDDERFSFGSEDFGDRFLYHYTSAGAMHKVLHAAALRLGRLSSCNDPRERKALFGRWSLVEDPEAEIEPSRWEQFEAEMEAYLYHQAYLACFTLDDRLNIDYGASFGRGFGHPRSWDQYGDRHRGACLVFDRERLEKRVEEWVERHPGCESSARGGRVEYLDRPVELGDENSIGINFGLRSVAEIGSRRRAKHMWIADFEALYLQKATDWAGEREYRVVLHCECDAAPLLDIRGCLVAIALGEEYGLEDEAVLRHRLRRSGLLPIAPARLRWTAGAPFADPLPGTELRTEPGPVNAWWN